MFNPRTRYMFHAEALEESVMSYTHGDTETWTDALTELLDQWDNNEAQKVLSELRMDTTKEGARERLARHYAAPEVREAVISSWHAAGQYLPGETQ